MEEVETHQEAEPVKVPEAKAKMSASYLEVLINSVRTEPIGMAHRVITGYKEMKNADPAVVARLESILNAR